MKRSALELQENQDAKCTVAAGNAGGQRKVKRDAREVEKEGKSETICRR